MLRRTGMAVLVACAATDSAPRVNECGTATITVEPARPVKGALFRVRVNGLPAGVSPAGFVAGEPLHFAGDSVAEALAAIPIENPDSVTINVVCRGTTAFDSLTSRVAVSSGDYPIERLRVAPAFGRPPDSATAARIE